MTNKQIGKQLHLSPFTVRHHVSQLIKKLEVANRELWRQGQRSSV